MSSLFALSPFGFGVFGGILSSPAPATRQTGEFEFSVRASPNCDGTIFVNYTVPLLVDSMLWARSIKILRKKKEWPLSHDDTAAEVVVDANFANIFQQNVVLDENLEREVTYYYALFALRNDGVWFHDRFTDRKSAYAYQDFGGPETLFDRMPRGWQSLDVTGHLEQFLTIFGKMVDTQRSDVNMLLQLFEIESIPCDLIPLLDATIAWPTWFETNGIQQRKETSEAVDVFKLVGRSAAYEQILSEISNWEVQVVEGWRYVMFSNGLYGSTTPDFAGPDPIPTIGGIDDILKYTSSDQQWQSIPGLGFFLTEVSGVSGPFTGSMLARTLDMIEEFKASFVVTSLTMAPVTEELYELSFRITDEFADAFTYSEAVQTPLVEELEWTTDELSLFISNDLTSTSNTIDDRTFHSALAYV